jgi:RND family efflux transporter MFP subunit
VRTEEAATFAPVLSARGYAEPERKADVAPKVFGVVEKIYFREGHLVKERDVIAELQNDDLEAQKAEAEVVLKHARIELDRHLKLWESRDTTEKAVQDARRDVDVAEARLRYVDALLENTLIRAPFAGKITKRLVNPGDTCGPSPGVSGAAVTLVDFDSLVVVVDVNQGDLGRIKGVTRAEIAIEGIERKYAGKVLWVVPTADRVKGIVQVKVAVEDRDEQVLPQMAARVTFLGEAGRGRRVVVPDGAERGGSVLVVENGRARKVDVSALRGGEEVILRPEGLLDGRSVRRK